MAMLPMSTVLRSEAADEMTRILGFNMIGSEASEVMAAIQTAMLAKMGLLSQDEKQTRSAAGAGSPVLRTALSG